MSTNQKKLDESMLSLTEPAKTSHNVAKAEPKNALGLPKSNVKFSNDDLEEVNGHDSAYLSRFNKLCYYDNLSGEIVIADQRQKDENGKFKNILWQGKTLNNVIVIYSHNVISLSKGAFENKPKEMFTAEDRKILAMTYDNVYIGGSKGTFQNQFENFISDKELREKLDNKGYFFLLIPEMFGAEIVPASFGGSSFKSFSQIKKQISSANYILPAVYLSLNVVRDSNKKTGQPYNRIGFDFSKNEKGEVKIFIDSIEKWEKQIKPNFYDSIKRIHEIKISELEQSAKLNISAERFIDSAEMDEFEKLF